LLTRLAGMQEEDPAVLAAERAQAKAAAAAAAATKLEKQLKAQTAVRAVFAWHQAENSASYLPLCDTLTQSESPFL
jgi:hypothetical protein